MMRPYLSPATVAQAGVETLNVPLFIGYPLVDTSPSVAVPTHVSTYISALFFVLCVGGTQTCAHHFHDNDSLLIGACNFARLNAIPQV